MASYEIVNDTEVLGPDGAGADARGLVDPMSRRRPGTGGAATEQTATSTSNSAVSRKFVAATVSALAELLSADLSTLDLVAFIVDGVHFAEHCRVVAPGIGIDGTEHR